MNLRAIALLSGLQQKYSFLHSRELGRPT